MGSNPLPKSRPFRERLRSMSGQAIPKTSSLATYQITASLDSLKMSNDLVLYNKLKRYAMNRMELRQNSFPAPDPKGRGRALFPALQLETRNNFKTNRRTCCRCKKPFRVDEDGFPLKPEACDFHKGTVFNNRAFDGRNICSFSCCGNDPLSLGCSRGTSHVIEGHPLTHEGFVKTVNKCLPMGASPGIYSMDCEMCYTTVGLELTRITVVDVNKSVIYESLVKPIHPIIDYNTKFSGIKEEHLRDVTTTLVDVQQKLLDLFSDETLIVGHSLQHDLRVTKLIHENIIDTSLIFPHPRGLPYKRALVTLTKDVLSRRIRAKGHDSCEDAIACMDLMLMKLRRN